MITSSLQKNSFYFSILNAQFRKSIKFGRLTIHFNGMELSYGNPDELPHGVMYVRKEGFFISMVKKGEIGLGESYVAQEWETPSLENVLVVLFSNYRTLMSSSSLFSKPLLKLRNFFSDYELSFCRENSQRAMKISYDVGNDFFKKTLGEMMIYTCAIFPNRESTLEEAQEHKIDVIVKKIRPAVGDKILDIGCGWGTLLKAFQDRFNCQVRGIALAEEQIKYCKESNPRGTFDYLDYRDLSEKDVYDSVVSIGMIEHVGQEHLQTYADKIAQVLKPNGRALLHTMIKGSNFYQNSSQHKHLVMFGNKYVMPASYGPHDYELNDALIRTGKLRILHQEKFGVHYSETIRRWVKNLLANAEEISKLYSVEHVKCYEYTWTSLGAAFTAGCGDLLQVLVEKNSDMTDVAIYDPR